MRFSQLNAPLTKDSHDVCAPDQRVLIDVLVPVDNLRCMARQAMTRISGYYNSAKWPILLVIPRLKVPLHLLAGEYILDPKGRKINDPYFEAFANHGQLSRDHSDVPVPIIGLSALAP